eukprot:5530952-Amphidinium_carterae.2
MVFENSAPRAGRSSSYSSSEQPSFQVMLAKLDKRKLTPSHQVMDRLHPGIISLLKKDGEVLAVDENDEK